MASRRTVLWSGPAIEDLREIRAYIVRDDPTAAKRLADRIRKRVLLLREQPLTGRVVPELEHRGFREVMVNPYRIVYEVEQRRVVVLRVWHGRRQLGGGDVRG